MFNSEKKRRKREKDFYSKTQQKKTMRELEGDIKAKPQKHGTTPAWTYKVGAVAG